METKVATCRPGEHLAEVRARLRASEDLCVVVNAENVVLGALRGKALTEQPDEAVVDDVMDPAPGTVRPHVSVQARANRLGGTRARRLLVTTGDGVLLGLLRREAVEQAAQTHGPHLASNNASERRSQDL
jgi:CBS domain-containing protein